MLEYCGTSHCICGTFFRLAQISRRPIIQSRPQDVKIQYGKNHNTKPTLLQFQVKMVVQDHLAAVKLRFRRVSHNEGKLTTSSYIIGSLVTNSIGK